MPSGTYTRTNFHKLKIKQGHSKNKGKKMPQMARKGRKNGMYGTKGWFEWRNTSGLRPRKKGEFKHTEASREKMSLSHTKNSLTYSAIHKWLVKKKGKAFGCKRCGLNDINREYEWSNNSGQHKRDVNDYESLCVPCHRAKDGNNELYKHSSCWKKKGR